MNTVPNPSLDTGLAALKQGNYSVAIAHLKTVRETELDESLVTRASQGLVIAYCKSGDTDQAITLCQELTHHPNPKIREWANTTLTDLNGDRVTPPTNPLTSDSTGFVPLAGTATPQPPPDSTGFVPLNPSPSQPQKTRSNIKQPLVNSTNRLFSNTKTQDTPKNKNAAPTPIQSAEPEQTHSVSLEENSGLHHTSTLDPSLSSPRPRWRNSGRAQNWSPLKPVKLRRLWFVEIVSAIALFVVLQLFTSFVLQTTNNLLVQLPYVNPIQLFYQDPTPAILIVLALLLILSPWVLDALLNQFHGLEALSLAQLTARSPEAAKVLQRICRQRKLPLPTLGILPTNAPVILSYGNLPRTARIVVSEGLLAQLADDEIATLYAGQLGHIAHWDFVLMSLGTLVLQIPYTIYWQVAQWGEQMPKLIGRKLPSYQGFLSPLLTGITGTIAAIAYGCYWLFRLPLLWLSRARVFYSDRASIEATGNPNGMVRALLKIAFGMIEEIHNEHQTHPLLESFDLLLPVGYRQAIALGSCSPQTPVESILAWDCTNPYRDWLLVSASHPLLGERSAMLCRNAQFWKLEPELDLPAIAPPVRNNGARLSKLFNSPKALPLLQGAVFFGLVLGIAFRIVLWVIGQIGDWLNIWQVIWMHKSRSLDIGQVIWTNKTNPIKIVQIVWTHYTTNPLLVACILVTFSLCIFLWINRYFPDIKPATLQTEPNLEDLIGNPASLPADSQPVQLTGKLLGRAGVLNWLGQDLILQTSMGLVRLHFSSYLGPFGNILPRSTRPSDLVNHQVTVTGWLRRGVTPWIDVESLRSQGGRVTRANYPLWLTLIALVAALWGAYLVWLT